MLSRSKVTLQTINKEKKEKEDEAKKEEDRRKNICKAVKISPDVLNRVSPRKSKNRDILDGTSPINTINKDENSIKADENKKFQLWELQEKDEEIYGENYEDMEESMQSDDEFEDFIAKEEVDVKIDKNQRYTDPEFVRLNEMFKPKPKKELKKKPVMVLPFRSDTDIQLTEDKDGKVNTKLLNLIQENKKLLSMIKCKKDINLNITIIRKYFTFKTLEYVRHYRKNLSHAALSTTLLDTIIKKKDEPIEKIKPIEGKAEIHMYDKVRMKIIKKKIKFDTKRMGTKYFLIGCRSIFVNDRIYISGGKTQTGSDSKLFLCYDIHLGKLFKMPDLISPRSYHTLCYHESLRILLAVGGERNSSCEMYDFYLNLWNPMPDLNIPRANTSLYINPLGSFCYAIGGISGSIISDYCYSDAIEYLDLVELTQGWIKIEPNNKANVDLTTNEIKVYPLSNKELLIYGGKESRQDSKGFTIFNMKTFDLTKVDQEEAQSLRCKYSKVEEANDKVKFDF